jgi:hypothetical protein
MVFSLSEPAVLGEAEGCLYVGIAL